MLSIFLIFMLLVAIFLLLIILSSFVGFIITRVPFVPTNSFDIEFFVKKLGITSNNVFYDLGSGDGKVVFLVNKLTGARCVGFELTWWTHLWAKLKLKLTKFSLSHKSGPIVTSTKLNIEFRNQNFFKVSWTGANYIYAYLYPPLMERVEQKFLTDCAPGSIAIVRDFPFPTAKPFCVYHQPRNHDIYLYKR